MVETMSTRDQHPTHLTTLPPRTVINLRGPEADAGFFAALGEVFGVAPPRQVNQWRGDDERFVISLGPDEWLVIASTDDPRQLEQRMRAARADDPWLSVVDVSHNYTVLTLAGPAARETLSKGCSIDLHARAFGPGRCAQTLLARTRALLECGRDADHIES